MLLYKKMKFLTYILLFCLKRINDFVKPETSSYFLDDYSLSFITKKLSDSEHLKKTIEKILIPRVVGTLDHDNVRDFIVNSMENMHWMVEKDKFVEKVPIFGKLTFENIIATLNPDADKFLILACHYDSKYMKDIEFYGAIDSAVPCAMLINLAHILTIKKYLTYIPKEIGFKIVFFDGEEAFNMWSPTDSIYGARHLCEKWNNEKFLKKIDMLVLLDLLGAKQPTFYSYFNETQKWYSRLQLIENRLYNNGLLEGKSTKSLSVSKYFKSTSIKAFIEDDHVPFLQKGVPILHLIPLPFPKEWHTKDDNYDIIDFHTVKDLISILTVFLVEYFEIDVKSIEQL